MEQGFWADKTILVLVFLAITLFCTAPLITADVIVTATVTSPVPTVGGIRICDGTCAVTKTNFNNNTWFTLEVTVTDPNGASDINTEMFRVTMFHNTDANTCTEDWDCNAMTILDDNISLFTANGCTQAGNVYCLNIPKTAWTTKFLSGDVNIYVAVDDNSGGYDSNHVDNNAFTIVKTTGRTEDTSGATYSAAPNTTNNEINNTDTSNNYVETTHNGNANLDVTLRGTDLNISAAPTNFIGDGNQSWSLNEDANGAGSLAFPGPDTTIMTDWNRGTYPTSSPLRLFYYLDIPNLQPTGDYNGAIVYGASAS